MAKGRELLCVAPTGSGKTAAFLIPLLARLRIPSKGSASKAPRALVVLPTRELAQQAARHAAARHAHRGCDPAGIAQTYREAQKLSVGIKFRVAVLTKARGAGGVKVAPPHPHLLHSPVTVMPCNGLS